ncbi:alpha/beta fold hydrolase [Thioclava sp. IC9]|uniref:alpha/beta fold hydrolase n=1 Tax=Thioclava sp. IC9 TaxID=1973007 RepID=UPI000B5403DA|nr:alpha/beta fold hydrolase [Thioclava sp. IC9]OWY03285.1 alpha/beta hydrolase [Thioclava sp. IC9]
MLNTTLYSSDSNPGARPLIIAPGLFGSARNWTAIAKRLSADRPVIALDMRNHGDSFWDDDHSYEAMAGDIAEVIEANGGVADVLGHSMGGKAAMTLALTRPERVEHLIVADIAPENYDHGDNHTALIEAMQEMDISDLTSRSTADERLGEQVFDPGTRAFLLQSLVLRDGPPRWKFNLAALKANMDSILGWPETLEGKQFDGPTLFLSGADSHYVQPEMHERIRGFFPQARFEEVDNAGHWLHAEKPREFEADVARFLNSAS